MMMETTAFPNRDELTAAYEDSVAREREAWHALQACAPGSPARTQAWDEWSAAIVRTNRTWRRLTASRIAHRASPAPQRHARS